MPSCLPGPLQTSNQARISKVVWGRGESNPVSRNNARTEAHAGIAKPPPFPESIRLRTKPIALSAHRAMAEAILLPLHPGLNHQDRRFVALCRENRFLQLARDILNIERAAEIVALIFVACLIAQKRQLRFILDAFRDNLQVQSFRHTDDRGRDGRIVRIHSHIPYERTIDL